MSDTRLLPPRPFADPRRRKYHRRGVPAVLTERLKQVCSVTNRAPCGAYDLRMSVPRKLLPDSSYVRPRIARGAASRQAP